MSYAVKYSAKQASWYVQVDGQSDDLGTSLYDTEREAYDELSQMVTEGLITHEEVTWPDCKHCGEEIEHIDETGWVETRSGDDGGAYDFCVESSTHRHTPEETR